MTAIEVAMAITRDPVTGQYLLLEKGPWFREHRARYKQTPWEVPGGKRQDGEAIKAAAKRELREETGLTGRVVATADPYQVTQTDADGDDLQITFHPCLLETDDDPDSVELTDTYQGEPEHTGYAWVALEAVADRLTPTELQAFDRLVEGFTWD